MNNGFFSRYGQRSSVESLAPGLIPRAEAAASAATDVAQVVRRIARKGLPQSGRKAAVSLRLDEEVLAWFKGHGPGYQTRMNAVLRAYMDAAQA
jgi:uncharacterized protein (DUF4415 family)